MHLGRTLLSWSGPQWGTSPHHRRRTWCKIRPQSLRFCSQCPPPNGVLFAPKRRALSSATLRVNSPWPIPHSGQVRQAMPPPVGRTLQSGKPWNDAPGDGPCTKPRCVVTPVTLGPVPDGWAFPHKASVPPSAHKGWRSPQNQCRPTPPPPNLPCPTSPGKRKANQGYVGRLGQLGRTFSWWDL